MRPTPALLLLLIMMLAVGATPQAEAQDLVGAGRLRTHANGSLLITTPASAENAAVILNGRDLAAEVDALVAENSRLNQSLVTTQQSLTAVQRLVATLGIRQWIRQLGTGAASRLNRAFGVATDHSNNIYIVGDTNGNMAGPGSFAGLFDVVLAKYDSTGTRLWTRQLGANGYDYSQNVATDGAGNVFVVGYTNSSSLGGKTNNGGYNGFLAKFNSAGVQQWVQLLGGPVDDHLRAIATDGAGNVFVAGNTFGDLVGTNAGNSDAVIAKYDGGSGAQLWVRQLGSNLFDFLVGAATDADGNAYLTGFTDGGIDGNTNAGLANYDMFVVKYSGTGAKQWTRQLGTPQVDYGRAVVATPGETGGIFVAGYTNSGLDGNDYSDTKLTDSDMFLTKYDSQGNKQFTRQFGTTSNDQARGVAADADGNIYVCGITEGALEGNANAGSGSKDIAVIKFNSLGAKQWVRQLGTPEVDVANSVATDGDGNVYAAGETSGKLDTSTTGTMSAGSSDMHLTKFGLP